MPVPVAPPAAGRKMLLPLAPVKRQPPTPSRVVQKAALLSTSSCQSAEEGVRAPLPRRRAAASSSAGGPSDRRPARRTAWCCSGSARRGSRRRLRWRDGMTASRRHPWERSRPRRCSRHRLRGLPRPHCIRPIAGRSAGRGRPSRRGRPGSRCRRRSGGRRPPRRRSRPRPGPARRRQRRRRPSVYVLRDGSFRGAKIRNNIQTAATQPLFLSRRRRGRHNNPRHTAFILRNNKNRRTT